MLLSAIRQECCLIFSGPCFVHSRLARSASWNQLEAAHDQSWLIGLEPLPRLSRILQTQVAQADPGDLGVQRVVSGSVKRNLSARTHKVDAVFVEAMSLDLTTIGLHCELLVAHLDFDVVRIEPFPGLEVDLSTGEFD